MSDRLGASNQLVTYKQYTTNRNLQAAITEIIAESSELDKAIIQLLESICNHTGWDFGEIWNVDSRANLLIHQAHWQLDMAHFPRFEEITRQITFSPGIGLPGRVWNTTRPLWIPDVVEDTNFLRASFAQREGLRGGVGIPLRTRDKVVGVMSFFSRTVRPPDGELLDLFDMIGQHIGLFIDRQQSHLKETERLQRQSALQERLQITQGLQSTMMKELFSVAVTAEVLPYLWESNHRKLWYGLGEIRQSLQKTLAESQSLVSQLQTYPWSESGIRGFLDPLLENFTPKISGGVSIMVEGDDQLPINVQVAIYCIVQEALENIIRHAYASNVKISLISDQANNTLFIRDNGKGFDLNNVLPDRLGLKIMRGCVEAIDGKLDIVTAANQGTQITVSWRNVR